MRACKAIITVATGRQGTRQFPVQRTESYATTMSLDGDADSFSIELGDPDNLLDLCLERDNEVRIQLFLDDAKGRTTSIFKGIVDLPQKNEGHVLMCEGRDEPSSLAVDSDAMPGRWKFVNPKAFITARAQALGITNVSIANMSNIREIVTDGSEKEWQLWYRIARMKGMYMWTDHQLGGRLVIGKLGYGIVPTYRFGQPAKGKSAEGWFGISAHSRVSNKQGRVRKVLVYGEDAKKGKALIASGIDTSITSWKKKPLNVMTDSQAKNQGDLKATADEEVFESIVGANELDLTIHDTGVLIQQNKMALVNLPSEGINNELWFVVGVARSGGPDGMIQRVRLREKGFALSKRVPDAPTLKEPDVDAANKPSASVSAYLAQFAGMKWTDSFVRATNEYGVPAGWDFAVFLGVLLAICDKETGGTFNNCRQGDASLNWVPSAQWLASPETVGISYTRAFANDGDNPMNPLHPNEAGCGPMQLTTASYKDFADKLGWNGVPMIGEYAGGRWNPDSNIRTAAKVLVDKLKAVGANPLNGDTIFLGVQAYNGSGPNAVAYADSVRQKYKLIYAPQVEASVGAVTPIVPGSATKRFSVPGHGTLMLSNATPDEAAKAITWAIGMLGDPYEWGGPRSSPPHYDCSSFVVKALANSAQYLRNILVEPTENPYSHGDNTDSIWKRGRFKAPADNELLPGDLVFFRGDPPSHVGMYIADGLFIHDPAPGKVVRINGLGEDYYSGVYSGARRVVLWPSGGD